MDQNKQLDEIHNEAEEQDAEQNTPSTTSDANPISEQTAVKLKRSVWKLWLFGMLGVIGLILILVSTFPIYMSVLTSDIDPIDDSDMVPSARIVPDEQNGFFIAKQMNEQVTALGFSRDELKGFSDGTSEWDEERVEEILSTASGVLLLAEEVASIPEYQDPQFSDPVLNTPDVAITSLSGLRTVSDLAVLRAVYALRVNDEESSIRYVILPIQLANKLLQPNTTSLANLVSEAMKHVSFDAIMTMLHSNRMSTSTLNQLLLELQEVEEDGVEGMTNAFQTEYVLGKNAIHDIGRTLEEIGMDDTDDYIFGDVQQLIKEGKKVDTFYFRPNESNLMWYELIHDAVVYNESGCATREMPEVEYLELPSVPQLMFTENALGKVLHAVTATSLAFFVDPRCETYARHILTETAVALHAARGVNGAFPNTLSKLIGTYVDTEPVDPFSDLPVMYDPERNIIYSWGKDRVDGGGNEETDIVLHLETE